MLDQKSPAVESGPLFKTSRSAPHPRFDRLASRNEIAFAPVGSTASTSPYCGRKWFSAYFGREWISYQSLCDDGASAIRHAMDRGPGEEPRVVFQGIQLCFATPPQPVEIPSRAAAADKAGDDPFFCKIRRRRRSGRPYQRVAGHVARDHQPYEEEYRKQRQPE